MAARRRRSNGLYVGRPHVDYAVSRSCDPPAPRGGGASCLKQPLRGVFVALLILTFGAQAARISRPTQPDQYVSLSDGLASLGSQVQTTPSSESSRATFPGCPVPVTHMRVGFDGTNNGSLSRSPTPDVSLRYVYLGFVGSRLDLAAIVGRWGTASALAVLGLRHASVPVSLVLVMVPKACPSLAGLDWSVLSPWDRGARALRLTRWAPHGGRDGGDSRARCMILTGGDMVTG